jgi:hypothetical protein
MVPPKGTTNPQPSPPVKPTPDKVHAAMLATSAFPCPPPACSRQLHTHPCSTKLPTGAPSRGRASKLLSCLSMEGCSSDASSPGTGFVVESGKGLRAWYTCRPQSQATSKPHTCMRTPCAHTPAPPPSQEEEAGHMHTPCPGCTGRQVGQVAVGAAQSLAIKPLVCGPHKCETVPCVCQLLYR